jgi:hypothetical protein
MQATQRSSIGGFSPLMGIAALVAIAALVVAAIATGIVGSALGNHGLGAGTAPVAGTAPKPATPTAAQVEAALIEVRRGEREPLFANAGSATAAQVEAALIEVRRGEREPLFANGVTSDTAAPGFGRLIPR